MADIKKSYEWSFGLNEYTMTKDIKEDYTVQVCTRKSMGMSDIAFEISAERTEYRVDTIVNIGAQYNPSLTGVFIGDKGVIYREACWM